MCILPNHGRVIRGYTARKALYVPCANIHKRPMQSSLIALTSLVGLFAQDLRTKSFGDEKSAKKAYQRIYLLAAVYNHIEGSKHLKIMVEFRKSTMQALDLSDSPDHARMSC